MQGDNQEAQGLAGSQHSQDSTPSPNATPRKPQPKKASTQNERSLESVKGLLDSLLALVPADKKATAKGLVKEIANQWQQDLKDLEVVTITSLQKAVTKAVQAAIKTAVSTPQACTWANVVTGTQGTTLGTTQDPPRKVVP